MIARRLVRGFVSVAVALCAAVTLSAQAKPQQPLPGVKPPQTNAQTPPSTSGGRNVTPTTPTPPSIPAGVQAPPDYVIGADDVLTIVFWREKDMSGDVYVRPDGMISFPLLNEVKAAGLSPEQLRVSLNEAASKFFEDPNIIVVVKQINSRKVYIVGQVSKPGPFPLMGPLTVMQLITLAGGPLEYADEENIGIVRTENGKPTRYRFNYKDFLRGRNLTQNITLKPGDQVVVP